jgi:GAF domain-containing protein
MTSPVAELMATFARELAAENDLDGVLKRVVEAAVTRIAGAQHAGITIVDRRSVFTPAATNDLVREIERHQYGIGEGPCLAAAVEHQSIVRVDDLSADRRWSEFAAATAALGIGSMVCFRLNTDAETIGALNVYAGRTHAFTDDAIRTGALLAAHVAVAVAAATERDHLRTALQTRETIGQAKGILMERHKISSADAFDLLVAASLRTNRKLRDVAADLAATGSLAAGDDHQGDAPPR